MTRRAVILGFLGAMFVCAFTYFNDMVMRQTMFVGNHMPISVYGGLIIFLLVFNPLLYYVAKTLVLTGKELAVVLALTLAACVIPGSGLLRTFTTSLIMPHQYNRTQAGWKDNDVLGLIPERMLAGVQPPYAAEDMLDPRGVARALGEAPTPQTKQVASLLEPATLQAVSSALAASMGAPPTEQKQAALAAVDKAVADRAARLGDEGGPPEEARAKLADAVTAAFAPPAADSPGSDETIRRLGLLMQDLKFERPEREAVIPPVRDALLAGEASCRAEVTDALNEVLYRAELYDADAFPNAPLTDGERAAGVAALEEERLARLNRVLVDTAFGDDVRSLEAKEDMAINGFIQGLSVGDERIGFGDIPWWAWGRTFLFWLPLILTIWIAIVAVAVIVHRQWSTYEQLPYPIAAFADALLPAEGQAKGSVFRNKLFLLGGGIVIALHINNYLCAWFPGLIRIPTAFEFWSLQDVWPLNFIRRGGGWFFFAPKLYLTPLAFAFFITTPVSFSLGIGATLFALISGIFAGYGVSMGGGSHYHANYKKLITAGAYVGMLLTVIYTGRHYYLSSLKKALRIKTEENIEPTTVWAMRVFLVAILMFTVQLVMIGLDWQIAIFYGLMTVGIFLVMSRICAETGVFFIQPGWAPGLLLIGLLGARAFGPTTIALMFMVSTVLLIDPREALMPYITNGLKILEQRGIRIGKPAMLFGGVLVVGIAVGLPMTMYWQYDRAAHMVDRWATNNVPKFTFDEVVRHKSRLEAQGSLEEAESVSGFARITRVTFDGGNVAAFVIGMGLVIGFAVARWRIPWWPIHPVMFIVWSWYAGYMLAFSLLIGCLVKTIVMKYGGEPVYQKVKPLFFGLIAGDMLGGVIPSIIGFIYYSITGEPPETFTIMPG